MDWLGHGCLSLAGKRSIDLVRRWSKTILDECVLDNESESLSLVIPGIGFIALYSF